MLYPLYKQIVQYKHEEKKNKQTNKHKQHKQMQASKNIIPLKYDKKEFSKQWQTKQLAIPAIKLKVFCISKYLIYESIMNCKMIQNFFWID